MDSGDNFLLQLYILINFSLACLLWLGLPVLPCLKMVNMDVLSYFGSYKEIFKLYPLRMMLTVGIFHMAYGFYTYFSQRYLHESIFSFIKNFIYILQFISFY